MAQDRASAAGRSETVDGPAEDNRWFVDGELYGFALRHAPVFADLLKDRENRDVMIDFSMERAHLQLYRQKK